MTGIDLLKKLKVLGDTTPFIIFTGRRDEVSIEAIHCGADFCVQKGGSPGKLFRDLNDLISLAVQTRRANDRLMHI